MLFVFFGKISIFSENAYEKLTARCKKKKVKQHDTVQQKWTTTMVKITALFQEGCRWRERDIKRILMGRIDDNVQVVCRWREREIKRTVMVSIDETLWQSVTHHKST